MEIIMHEDIEKALHGLRMAFVSHGIPCPDVLEYSDSAKAYKAITPLRKSLGPTSWSMDNDASPYGEACLAGFTLRFEARRIERPGTGSELDDGVSGRIFGDNL